MASVRPGHWKSVEYLGSDAFREVRAALEGHDDVDGVYYRARDGDLLAVDLHPKASRPLGPLMEIPVDATVDLLRPRIDALEPRRITGGRGPRPTERRFEAGLIRRAQDAELALPHPFDGLRLISSQWRLPGEHGRGEWIDLLAVDPADHALVIIELKLGPNVSAEVQAYRYMRAVRREDREFLPFFSTLARAMGALYDCPELASIELERVGTPWVSWPAGGRVVSKKMVGMDVQHDVGPQFQDASPFRRRMRFHQSWYRRYRLDEIECGIGPKPSSTRLHGNMLTEAAAEAGKNFLDPLRAEIFRVVRERGLRGDHAFRCERNMLSSQPMCFNLFGPLKLDLGLATRVFRVLLPGDVDRVERVEIEYPGEKGPLGDRTSLDAMVVYRRPDGERAFVGIETKLSDTFSEREYPLDHKPRYGEITTGPGSIWKQELHERLPDTRWNQLWRNHMLVQALAIDEADELGGQGRLMVVRHPEDVDGASAVRAYRGFLKDDAADTFVDMPLDVLVALARPVLETDTEREWLDAFTQRYVDLASSEHAWLAYQLADS